MPPKKAVKRSSKAPSPSASPALDDASSSDTPQQPQPPPPPSSLPSSSSLPLWLTEGSSQRDKNVLCESVYIYTPDGKHELIRNAKVQFVAGRRYGLVGRNGIGKCWGA